MLHAGQTPANSPRLFERIGEARAAHLARLAAGAPAGAAKRADGATTASAAGGGGTRCGHFMIAQGETMAGTFHVTAHALMSCFNEMDNITLDQAIFQANEDETNLELLAAGFAEDFAGVEVRTPVLHGSLPAGTGEVEFTYTRFKTEADAPATIRADGGEACCQFEHPRDATGDGHIRLCMFAGGIQVGDNEMQFDMERQSKRASAERKPSPAWETDRKNAKASAQISGRR